MARRIDIYQVLTDIQLGHVVTHERLCDAVGTSACSGPEVKVRLPGDLRPGCQDVELIFERIDIPHHAPLLRIAYGLCVWRRVK